MELAFRRTMMSVSTVYRNELKYLISHADAAALKSRLAGVLHTDPYAADGAYRVRSLYYDTPYGRDYREKLDGLEKRQKLRLRIYDEHSPRAKLELKQKNGSLQHKTSLEISRADAQTLAGGIYTPLFSYQDEAAMRLYAALMTDGYRPAVIIEYDRTAYTYPDFDVRLTLDAGVRSSETNLNLYEERLPWNPVFTDAMILEIKFNRMLPGFIQKLLKPCRLTAVSFSKYCTGRPVVGTYLL